MVFTRYAGVLTMPGFVIAAAFGINRLTKNKINVKSLILAGIISISVILLFLIPTLQFLFSPDGEIDSGISRDSANNWVTFQIFQMISFVILAVLISVAVTKNNSAFYGLIALIILELFLYIPFGLFPTWMIYKSLLVLFAMSCITFLLWKPNRLAWRITETKNVKISVIVGIMAATVFGGVLISDISPTNTPQKHSYQLDPASNFIKENLGFFRIFSLDYVFGPNYPVAYKINTIGIMGAYNIASFYSFNHNFLDEDAWLSNLGYPSMSSRGFVSGVENYIENKNYFDFLGVKYIVTQGYTLDTVFAAAARTNTFVEIKHNEMNIGQSFVSNRNTINAIGISFGTYLLENQGDVILTLDSVPPDPKYHRESTIQAQDIMDAQFNEFKLTPPLEDVINMEFNFSLKYITPDPNNRLAVFTYDSSTNEYSVFKDTFHGQFYENDLPVDDKQMALALASKTLGYSTVFQLSNINIIENPDVYPRTFLVNQFVSVESDDAQNFLLNNPDFDLRHNVVLEEQLSSEQINQLKSSSLQNSNAEIISYEEDKITINVNSDAASLLILTDTYYTGWKAYVDGVETEIYRADGLVRAVFVPTGNHTVEFSYLPDSFVNGVIISLVTGGVLLSLFVYSNKRKINKSI